MKHIYRDDPLLCFAPLLGNGELLCSMDAEGGVTHELPAPCGLPGGGIYRLGRTIPGEPCAPSAYLSSSLTLGKYAIGRPIHVSTEFSTEEAIFSSVCDYERGIRVETRACAVWGHPVLAVTKRISAPAPITLTYSLTLPKGSPYTLRDMGDMLVGERTGAGLREKMCFYTHTPLATARIPGGASLICHLPRESTTTFYLVFATSDDKAHFTMLNDLTKEQSYLYRTGEARLFAEHAASWRAYYAESSLTIGDEDLAVTLDGSRYLLRALGAAGGTPLVSDHPAAPLGVSPSVELRVISALLGAGHLTEARRLLSALGRLFPGAGARFGAIGAPGALFPRYTDVTTRERLTEDEPQGDALSTADAALAFYRYYEYTGDRNFLRDEAFPILKSCAGALLHRAVKTEAGLPLVATRDPFTGSAAAKRPLLSTVAVSSALLAYADAAMILGVDSAPALRARGMAERMLAGLPIRNESYVRAEGTDLPGRAPLYLSPYPVRLKRAPLAMATLLAGVSARPGAPTLYDLALGAAATANLRGDAISLLRRVAEESDVFGFLPTRGAEGMAEIPALFLDAITRTIFCLEGDTLYCGAGLDPDGVIDAECRIPLSSGVIAEATLRGGRFATLRLTSPRRGGALPTVIVAKHRYIKGAAKTRDEATVGANLHLTMA